MRNKYITAVESAQIKPKVPDFKIGDRVSVGVRIVEGNKERIQPFIGDVIARRGAGVGEMFTVRRIVNNEGVERTFPVHSPRIAAIEVQRSGKTRRAKLYFLRDRVGKARKLREKRSYGKTAAERTAPVTASAPREVEREAEPAVV